MSGGADEALALRLHRELSSSDADVAMATPPLLVAVANSDAAQLDALSPALFAHRRVVVDDPVDDDDRAVYCVASSHDERLRLIADLDALTSKCASGLLHLWIFFSYSFICFVVIL